MNDFDLVSDSMLALALGVALIYARMIWGYVN